MKLTFYVIVDTTKKQEFLKGGVPVSAIVYFSRNISEKTVTIAENINMNDSIIWVIYMKNVG